MSTTQFEGILTGSTPRALWFRGHFWEKELMFPKSQVTVIEEESGMSVVLKVRDWLAHKRDLKEFTEYTSEEIDARSM